MDDSREAEVRESAQALYGDGQKIWHAHDAWNVHKRAGIEAFVRRHCLQYLCSENLVLNAGAGSERYGWMPAAAVNSDLFLAQVQQLPRAVVSDICQLPFPDELFDVVVCVGSVLNYASMLEALTEIHRCLRTGGHAIIHFESSNSFEQWFSSNWNRAVARIETINSGRADKIWVYSPRFVSSLMESIGLKTRRRSQFHIASAAASRLGIKQQTAARFAALDGLLSFAGWAADDHIILAEKAALDLGANLA